MIFKYLLILLISFCEIPTSLANNYSNRVKNYKLLKNKLAELNDEQILGLIKKSTTYNVSDNTQTKVIDLFGVKIFVKRIPITKNELINMSTRNIYQLPMFYQYGIGSLGFGVLRELKSAKMASKYVLRRQCLNFPLLYHYRIIKKIGITSNHKNDLKKHSKFWGENFRITSLLHDKSNAEDYLYIFMEYFPNNIKEWIIEQSLQGNLQDTVEIIVKKIKKISNFLKSQKFLHMDSHIFNILTDGHTIYYADFGLAIHESFQLSNKEKKFLNHHISKDYDKKNAIYSLLIGLAYCVPNAKKEGSVNYDELMKKFTHYESKNNSYLEAYINIKDIKQSMKIHKFFIKLKEKVKLANTVEWFE